VRASLVGFIYDIKMISELEIEVDYYKQTCR
jgi:hypothetical protein